MENRIVNYNGYVISTEESIEEIIDSGIVESLNK